jgi:hypothetical protein
MQTTLLANNNITKTFKAISKVGGEIDVFITKAFDEDTSKHFLVINIPFIPLLGVERIQLPISFESEEFRNNAFDEQVTEDWVSDTVVNFQNQILESKKNTDGI